MCVCRKGEREEKEGNLSEIYTVVLQVYVWREMESVWRKRQSEGKKGNFSEIFAAILQVCVWRERERERDS